MPPTLETQCQKHGEDIVELRGRVNTVEKTLETFLTDAMEKIGERMDGFEKWQNRLIGGGGTAIVFWAIFQLAIAANWIHIGIPSGAK